MLLSTVALPYALKSVTSLLAALQPEARLCRPELRHTLCLSFCSKNKT